MLRLLAGEAARRFGARAAVVSGSMSLSFTELDRLSDQVAAGLTHRGVRVGDLVALALPDGPEFVLCYLAAAKIGALTAGCGPGKLPDGLRPDLVITEPGPSPAPPGVEVITLPVRRGLPYSLRGVARDERPPPPFPPDPERPVVVAFTSGRTGPRKGAVFGDRQLAAIRAHGAGTRWGTGDARLVTQPLGHLSFATRLPIFLQTGRTSHLLPCWEAGAAVEVLRRHRIRVLQGSPRQLAELLATGAELPDLTLVLSGGAPAPPGLIRALRERYGVPVCNRYLCTEAGLGLGTRPDDPPEDAEESVGRPRAGVDVAIRDAAGRPVEEGEEGEVLLRSPAVMTGYLERSRDRSVFARDGFIRTGDRGYIDHTGRLRLAGRTLPSGPVS
ncbi:class I adenylate-forming enzyme family protein [Nonomuraea sp. NPDC050328]|uniref:class I adenylate-forming enzyme family protein n=1 Tax=Nonomuraea sp. NPDC050328 TaxID=3364361 RepID=UPI0037B5758D